MNWRSSGGAEDDWRFSGGIEDDWRFGGRAEDETRFALINAHAHFSSHRVLFLSDQDLHCFPCSLWIHYINWNHATELAGTWVNQEGGGDRGSRPPRKSQVAIGFLRNSGMDYGPPREAVGALGSNCFWKEVCTYVPPCVNYVDKKKKSGSSCLTEFSGSAHGENRRDYAILINSAEQRSKKNVLFSGQRAPSLQPTFWDTFTSVYQLVHQHFKLKLTLHNNCPLPSYLLLYMHFYRLHSKQYGPRSDCSQWEQSDQGS